MPYVCTPEELRRLVLYHPDSGELFWRKRTPEDFLRAGANNPQAEANRFNSSHAGNRCFQTEATDGYLRAKIFGRGYFAHKVIWAITYGYMPDFIDHIDGNPKNNSLSNLREASVTQNNRNKARPKNNTSGCVGVHFCRAKSRWIVSVAGRRVGSSRLYEDAVKMRRTAQREYGFSDRHGL